MRIFRGYARKARRATGDDTGVYRPSEPQADETETWKYHSEDPVTMAERYHLFPSRTQQLSSHASKVLGWKRPGRIDCCRSETKPPYYTCGGFYYGSDVWDFRFLLILFNFLYISRNAVSLQLLIIFKIFPVLLLVHFCETRYNKIIMY